MIIGGSDGIECFFLIRKKVSKLSEGFGQFDCGRRLSKVIKSSDGIECFFLIREKRFEVKRGIVKILSKIY